MSDETKIPGPKNPGPKIPVSACPICGKPAVEKHRPFCSRRCAQIDLSRWIGGNYRVPTRGDDDPEEDRPALDEEEHD